MSADQLKDWFERFDELYEECCEGGEAPEDAIRHAEKTADKEIYQEERI